MANIAWNDPYKDTVTEQKAPVTGTPLVVKNTKLPNIEWNTTDQVAQSIEDPTAPVDDTGVGKSYGGDYKPPMGSDGWAEANTNLPEYMGGAIGGAGGGIAGAALLGGGFKAIDLAANQLIKDANGTPQNPTATDNVLATLVAGGRQGLYEAGGRLLGKVISPLNIIRPKVNPGAADAVRFLDEFTPAGTAKPNLTLDYITQSKPIDYMGGIGSQSNIAANNLLHLQNSVSDIGKNLYGPETSNVGVGQQIAEQIRGKLDAPSTILESKINNGLDVTATAEQLAKDIAEREAAAKAPVSANFAEVSKMTQPTVINEAVPGAQGSIFGDAVKTTVIPDAQIHMGKVNQIAGEWVDLAQKAGNLDAANRAIPDLQRVMSNPNIMTYDIAQEFISQATSLEKSLNTAIPGSVGASRASILKKEAVTAMEDALELADRADGGNRLNLWSNARADWAKISETFSNPTTEKILKLVQDKPQGVINFLFQPNNVKAIQRVQAATSPQEFKNLASLWQNKIINAARDEGTGLISGVKLKNSIKTMGDTTVRQILGRDGTDFLNRYAEQEIQGKGLRFIVDEAKLHPYNVSGLIFTNGDPTIATIVKGMVKKDAWNNLEKNYFQRLIADSMENGKVGGLKLEDNFAKAKELTQALDPSRVALLKRFINAAKFAENSVVKSGGGGKLAGAILTAGAIGSGIGVMTDPGNIKTNFLPFMGSAAAVVAMPRVLAKILVNPRYSRMLADGLTAFEKGTFTSAKTLTNNSGRKVFNTQNAARTVGGVIDYVYNEMKKGNDENFMTRKGQ